MPQPQRKRPDERAIELLEQVLELQREDSRALPEEAVRLVKGAITVLKKPRR